MEEKDKATETNAADIAPQEVSKVAVEDLEAKNAELEAEKAKLLKEKTNYQAAYLKEAARNKDEDESEDEKMYRIAQDVMKNSRLAEITREQDALLQKALKERSELIRLVTNKPDVPASTTSHSEGQKVKDTLVTDEQMALFKSQGRSDQWIQNYKKNLIRLGR